MKNILKYALVSLGLAMIPLFASASILGVQQGGTGGSTFTIGQCIVGNGINPFTSQPCGSGGGGSGGTWSTTTSQVAGELINYSNNTTDIVCIGGTATSTCKFIFDPNSQIGYFSKFIGINVKTPAYNLDVTGGTGFISQASTTQLTVSGQPWFTGIGSAGGISIDSNGRAYTFSTSTWTFASSTLLGDNNTFTGNDVFSNLITGSISGNAGTATKLATGRTISITGDLAYTSPSFDGSGNVTAAGTLATVNSNTGSFGGTNSIPSFTVNGKGLITAASANTPSIPASEITSGTFGTGNYIFPAQLQVNSSTTLQNFTALNATTTNATTTGSLNVTGFLTGAGLSSCNSASNALTWNLGMFGCNTITGGSGSGLGTSTPWTIGNVAYVTSNGTVGSTPTTTVSCSGSASCTPFTVLGSSPITISATGGSGSAYPFPLTTPAPGNATSTLTQFNGGLTSYASSTIGAGGTQNGLTVNGSATTTGSLTVGTSATSAFSVDPTTGNVAVGIGNEFIGTGSILANSMLGISSSSPTFLQGYITNTNSGSGASADWVVNNNLSTNSTYFGDLGINSSTFSQAGQTGEAANDVFLTSSDSNLDLGASSSTGPNSVNFFSGGLNSGNLVAAMTPATTTFSGTGGINLTSGCFAIATICMSGGGAGTNYFSIAGAGIQTNTGSSVGINTAPNLAALEVLGTTTGGANTGRAIMAWNNAPTPAPLFSVGNDGFVGIGTSTNNVGISGAGVVDIVSTTTLGWRLYFGDTALGTHSATTIFPSNRTFGAIFPANNMGGLEIQGLSIGNRNGLTLQGVQGASSFNKLIPSVIISGAGQSGAGLGNLTGDSTMIQFQNITTAEDTFMGNGFMGIGSSTPFGALGIMSASSTANLVVVSTTTGSTLMMLDSKGNEYNSSSDTPVVSSCGSGATVAAGSNNNVGRITVGSTALQTSCILTFADGGFVANPNGNVNAPACDADPEGGVIFVIDSNPTQTSVTFTSSATFTSDTFTYQCKGF